MNTELAMLAGRTFGILTAKVYLGKDEKSHHMYNCLCECGEYVVVRGGHLLDGTKSCGCRQGTNLRPYESLYNRILSFTKHPNNITYEEFLEFTKEKECHYCGSEVIFRPFIHQGEGYNLDRKDSSLGYSKENCVVCCKRCNIGKNALFSYDEWVQIGKLIRSWHA